MMTRKGKMVLNLRCSIAAIWAGVMFIACEGVHSPSPDYSDSPRNVSMKIDGDSIATCDTVIRVGVSGDNLDLMFIGADSLLSDAVWEPYAAVKILSAPRREETFWAYGRFASDEGETTGVYRDSIIIDLTVRIDRFFADAVADTILPGDAIAFSLYSGEPGTASVTLGEFLVHHPLDYVAPGLFQGSFVISPGIGDWLVPAYGYFMDIAGNEADSVASSDTFRVHSTTINPRLAAHLTLPGVEGADVWFRNGYCFMSDWNSRLRVINMSNPSLPIPVNLLWMSGSSNGIFGIDQRLYVADGVGGLAVVHLEPPGTPELVSRTPVAGEPSDVVINGDYAYVACVFTGLKTYELGYGGDPIEVATNPLTTYGESVFYDQDRVYVCGGWGCAVVDVHDPDQPRLLSEFSVGGIPHALVESDGWIFVATELKGLLVFDASNPANPVLAAQYLEYDDVRGLALMPPYLFLGGPGMLWMVNIADPRAIHKLKQIQGMGRIRGIFADTQFLYLAEENGFSVVSLYSD